MGAPGDVQAASPEEGLRNLVVSWYNNKAGPNPKSSPMKLGLLAALLRKMLSKTVEGPLSPYPHPEMSPHRKQPPATCCPQKLVPIPLGIHTWD